MLTSTQNKKFKMWNKLKTKKYRDQLEMFLVYGSHLIEEANKVNAIVEVITTNPDEKGTIVSNELMNLLSQSETTYSVMAVCKKPDNHDIISDHILMLDDVQDPDNMGALFRSALAFGYNQVIISNKSADQYNEKTIRSSKGALFKLNVERKDLLNEIEKLKKADYTIVAADAHENSEVISKPKKLVLILGNEGNGINQDILDKVDLTVKINTRNVESLNVSVAGSILMYEWSEIK